MMSMPMIAVRSVRASADWYCRLLACQRDSVADDFERLRHEDRVLLLVHAREAPEHGAWEPIARGQVGDGFLLWILTADFDGVYERARSMGAAILVEPHRNADDEGREFTLRDPDGYAIAVSESLY
jgi:catechol 2,3-dioxygenase-like lactoylglutathione lyase family enzyme